MKFVNFARYVTDSGLIAAVRPAHRDYAQHLKSRGLLIAGGPVAGDRGGIFIFEAASMEEIEALVRQDPYTQRGVYASCDIQEWHIAGTGLETL
jgi:uncharacterized protein